MNYSPPPRALLSMGFSRQEWWSGLPYAPPGDLPDPGIRLSSPDSPALQADSLPTEPSGKPPFFLTGSCKILSIVPCALQRALWGWFHWLWDVGLGFLSCDLNGPLLASPASDPREESSGYPAPPRGPGHALPGPDSPPGTRLRASGGRAGEYRQPGSPLAHGSSQRVRDALLRVPLLVRLLFVLLPLRGYLLFFVFFVPLDKMHALPWLQGK